MSTRHTRDLAQSAAFVLLLALSSAATAADYSLSSDGNAVVRIKASSAANRSGFDSSLITSAYAGWTVAKSALGSVSTLKYDAGWSGGSGGAEFKAVYSQGVDKPAGSTLNWVQVINTNAPLGGSTTPYIDPRPNDDSLPFYWTSAEAAAFGSARALSFSDYSKRAQSQLPGLGNHISWSADLFPAIYDGAKGVTIGDGVTWGWDMKPATVGSAAGTFVSPSPTCPPATCSGVGSNTIMWGEGSPGSLSFAGSNFAPKVGDVFKIGTLTYHNGSTVGGTEITGVGLDIALTFANIAEENLVFHSTLGITNTPNTDDPIASADFVSFTSGGFPASFNVQEGQTASVDLMAKLSARLDPTPAAASGDKDPDGTPTDESPHFLLALVGFQNPTTGGFVSTIPEAGTWATMILGMILTGAVIRRREPLRLAGSA